MRRRWMHFIVGMLAICLLCGCNFRVPTVPSEAREQTVQKDFMPAVFLKFPVTLPDSGLMAEELICYSGPYWEDGSGEMVENVAGLMLYNPTDRLIEFAAFSLEEEGQRLYFFVHHLPPQSRCLVLEYTRKSCDPALVTAYNQLSIRWDYQELSREQIDYVGLGPMVTLTNRDTRQIKHVTVWYKQYVQSGDYYLGGAVYSAHVFDLQPGQQRTIQPERYDAGCARIVGIELEM